MTDSIVEGIRRDMKNLVDYVTQMSEDAARIKADQRWSDTYKQQQLASSRQYWQDGAKGAFERGRKRMKQRVEEARAAVQRANAQRDAGVDYQRLGFLREEIAAELRKPSSPMLGDTPLSRVKQIADRARTAGDRETLRAVRLAAADLVAGNGDSDLALLTQVRRDFAGDLEAEWREVRSAEETLKAAEVGAEEYDAIGLQVERQLYNLPPVDMFSTLTDWQRDVMQMTPESAGRIVDKSQIEAVSGPL